MRNQVEGPAHREADLTQFTWRSNEVLTLVTQHVATHTEEDHMPHAFVIASDLVAIAVLTYGIGVSLCTHLIASRFTLPGRLSRAHGQAPPRDPAT